MNIIAAIMDLLKTDKPTVAPQGPAHTQTPIGGGYYALQDNKSQAGIVYTKLVQADKSRPTNRILQGKKTLPLTGSRSDRPSTRRARRNVPRAS